MYRLCLAAGPQRRAAQRMTMKSQPQHPLQWVSHSNKEEAGDTFILKLMAHSGYIFGGFLFQRRLTQFLRSTGLFSNRTVVPY